MRRLFSCRAALALTAAVAALAAASASAAMPSDSKAAVGAAPATSDPATLALASRIAAAILPDGTFQQIMDASIGQMSKSMMDGMLSIPINTLAKSLGQDPEKIKALDSTRLKDVLSIMDPAFQERTDRSMAVTASEIGKLMTSMEPSFREGLAEAYARRFSLAELRDIDAFFQTNAGKAFAAGSMTIQTDPAFFTRMQQFLPAITNAMPQMMKKMQERTADLPKPKKPQDLSPAERERLATLLGLDPAEMK